MSRLAHLGLVSLCACGQVASGGDAGALPDSAGSACDNADALASPPTCPLDPDGGPNVCQQWADTVVSGATGYCANGECTLGLSKGCTPGPDGDAQCQAWVQNYAKTTYAYAKCWARGPNDPGAWGNICVAADQCVISSGFSRCTCGPTDTGYRGCDLGHGVLCLNVGGTPTCGPWCQ